LRRCGAAALGIEATPQVAPMAAWVGGPPIGPAAPDPWEEPGRQPM
jgi:hypothetical protein